MGSTPYSYNQPTATKAAYAATNGDALAGLIAGAAGPLLLEGYATGTHAAVSEIGRVAADQWEALPSAAEPYNVASSSPNDVNSPMGSGASQVKTYWMSANWEIVSEIIDMNGTTPVTTAASYLFPVFLETEALINNTANAGDVLILPTGSGRYHGMEPGRNRSEIGLIAVPSGYTAELIFYSFDADTADFLHSALLMRPGAIIKPLLSSVGPTVQGLSLSIQLAAQSLVSFRVSPGAARKVALQFKVIYTKA